MKQTKRVISFVLVLTMIVAMFSMNFTMASAADTAPLLGDVNRSSTVTILDASLIQKSVAKLPGSTNYSALPADDIEVQIADVNNSKTVTILDASIIQKWVAKDSLIRAQYPGIGKALGEPVIPSDGYYVIGKINGAENWETYSEAYKLSENPGAEGEYMIDMTFVDGDAIKVVKVEEGVITTWYKDGMDNEYKLTDEGNKTGDCTVYFRPDGNEEWSYFYLTVVAKEVPATEEPQPPTEDGGEITDGYYVIGKINGVENWETVTAAYKLNENPGAEGEYCVDMTFVDGDGIKAVKVENGVITTWYKDGLDNEYKLTDEGGKTGECTVYFRPDGNSEWSYTYLTVQKKTVEPGTEEPATEPSGDITDGYYIVGVINGVEDWSTIKAANKLVENPAAAGEYTVDMTFVDGDAIKAVKVENGAIATWYKDGMGNEYKLTDEGGKTGECTVYFRPDGNSEWSYTYLTVQKKSAEPATEAPATQPSGEITDGYYVIGKINGVENWDTVTPAYKLAENAAAAGEYTVDMTFVDGDGIKVVEVKDGAIATWYKDGMDNEYKLTDEGSKTGECTVYFRPTGNPDWSYTYLTVQKKAVEPATEEPATQPSGDVTDGYYVIGKIGGVENWDSVTPAYKLAENAAAAGEYSVEMTFADGDAIKVVKVENGAITTWYKDGMDNEYKLTEAGGKTGDCTVYFRPEGNFPTWSYTYFTVIKKEVPTEEPETEAPVAPAEDGFYLIGKIDGVENWDTVSADNKLAANEAAEGEYTIDKTFAHGDYIKVVEVKNNEFINWYKDGMGDSTLYHLTEEDGNTGECTVYFRPDGNPAWFYTYLTVIKKEAPVATEPHPITLEDGYYLISNNIDWDIYQLTAADKLAENAEAEGEYMLERTFKDGDAIKVVKITKSVDGIVTTWYKSGIDSEYKLTDEGGKTGDCTVYFRPDGNPGWSYTYLTVIKKAVPETEVTFEDGYYLIGIIDDEENWSSVDPENKLAANEGTEGEYLIEKTFKDGDAIKVVEVKDGAIVKWFKEGMKNEYQLTEEGGKTGECTVYFRPAGNDAWSYTYLTVVKKVEPTEAPATEAPIVDGYYVIGVIGGETNWDSVSAANLLVANPETEGEYSIDMTFQNNDAIKVVEVKDGAIITWFNDVPNGQYVLTDEGGKTGDCTVYFRPEGNFPTWSYTYFTVTKKEIPTTAPETDAPIVIDVEDGYYLMGTINGETEWAIPAAENELAMNPEVDGEFFIVKEFKAGDSIKVVAVKNNEIISWYKPGPVDTYDITETMEGECTLYFRPAGNDAWSYYYLTVVKNNYVEPETEPKPELNITEDGYYLISAEIEWDIYKLTSADKLAENADVEGEYFLERNFKDGDAIKVVHLVNVESGAPVATWYKDGFNSEYKLTEEGGKTGDCTVYFRPAGNYPDWSYNFMTVIPKEAPATEAPTEEVEDVVEYYLMGIIDGVENWDTLSEENKLTESRDVEGEYFIEKTFKKGDAIKVAKAVNGAITDWYKDGLDTELKLTATGDCTVYFRPVMNPDWQYLYIFVAQKAPTTTLADGYYVIGNYIDWEITNLTKADLLVEKEDVKGEYTVEKIFKDGDAIKVVEIKDGKDVKWFKEGMTDEYKLTEEGGKTGECIVSFNPAGNAAWTYTYITVAKKEYPVEYRLEDGYYLIGEFNKWEVDNLTAEDKLSANEEVEGEYTITKDFTVGGYKVVEVKNDEAVTYFKKGYGNEYSITADSGKVGEHTLYFRPEGNDAWSYTYFTVVGDAPATEAPTEEPTEPVVDDTITVYFVDSENWGEPYAYYFISDEKLAAAQDDDAALVTAIPAHIGWPGVKMDYASTNAKNQKIFSAVVPANADLIIFGNGKNVQTHDIYEFKDGDCFYLTIMADDGKWETSSEPYVEYKVEIDDGYYLIGNYFDWDASKLRSVDELKESTETPGEYTIRREFNDGDSIKVVKIENNAVVAWYKDGVGTEYVLTDEGGKTGLCDLFFRPEGNPDWSYKYLTVQKYVEPTEAPTEAPVTYSTVYFTDSYNWGSAYIHFWTANDSTKWPGEKMEYVYTNEVNQKVYKFEQFPSNAIGIVFNNGKDGADLRQTVNIEDKNGISTAETNAWYAAEINKEGKLTVGTWFAVPPTEAPATEAPTEHKYADGYYVIGDYDNWTLTNLTDDDLLVESATKGLYTVEKTFKDGDKIKVVKVEGNKITQWFKTGMENEYVLTDEGGKTGLCTVYFRPEGNSEWTYTYIRVLRISEPATEAPATEAPVEDDSDMVFVTNSLGWDTVYAYCWTEAEGGNDAQLTGANDIFTWPGVEMELSHYNEYNQPVYKTELPIEANRVIFNNGLNSDQEGAQQTEDIPVSEGMFVEKVIEQTGEVVTTNGCWLEKDSQSGDITVGGYFEQEIEQPSTEAPTSAPETDAPATIEDGYYLTGVIGGVEDWTAKAENKLTAGSEGEYSIDKTFVDGDKIKVAEVKDGEIKAWYKDGIGNEYNLTEAGGKTGNCTVYFRPAGNYPDWSYTYLTVQKKSTTDQFVYTFTLTADPFCTMDFEVDYAELGYTFVDASYPNCLEKKIDESDPDGGFITMSINGFMAHDMNDPEPINLIKANAAGADDNFKFQSGKKLVVLTLSGDADSTAVPTLIFDKIINKALSTNTDGSNIPFSYTYTLVRLSDEETVASGSGSFAGGAFAGGRYAIPAAE